MNEISEWCFEERGTNHLRKEPCRHCRESNLVCEKGVMGEHVRKDHGDL